MVLSVRAALALAGFGVSGFVTMIGQPFGFEQQSLNKHTWGPSEVPKKEHQLEMGTPAVAISGWEPMECFPGGNASTLCEATGFCSILGNCTQWRTGTFTAPDVPLSDISPKRMNADIAAMSEWDLTRCGQWERNSKNQSFWLGTGSTGWYSRSEIFSKLKGRRVAIIGDSLMRQVGAN